MADVRPATLDDAEALARIDRESRPEAWTLDSYRQILGSPTASRKVWVLAQSERGEGIGGFLVGTAIEPSISEGTRWAGQAEIEVICVSADHRRRGYASRLIQAFHRWACARGTATFFLQLRASNHAARSFYEARGYHVHAERKRYFRDGEDALCMRLDLSPEELAHSLSRTNPGDSR